MGPEMCSYEDHHRLVWLLSTLLKNYCSFRHSNRTSWYLQQSSSIFYLGHCLWRRGVVLCWINQNKRNLSNTFTVVFIYMCWATNVTHSSITTRFLYFVYTTKIVPLCILYMPLTFGITTGKSSCTVSFFLFLFIKLCQIVKLPFFVRRKKNSQRYAIFSFLQRSFVMLLCTARISKIHYSVDVYGPETMPSHAIADAEIYRYASHK